MLRKIIYILVLAMMAATPLVAQELPVGDPRNSDFAQRFEEIKNLNNGEDFMKMRPGAMYLLPDGKADFLDESDTYGIWGHEFQKTYGISYEESLAGKTPGPPVATTVAQSARTTTTESSFASPLWNTSMILLVLVLTFVGLWLWNLVHGYMLWNWSRERELRRDPITSGTPYVAGGGIPPTEPERLGRFYDELATTAYLERNPGMMRSEVRPERIGPIESGTITGEGPVGYMGSGFAPRRITQPLRAYRARYRFPDGTEDDLVTLQACMNPVAYRTGEVYRGFTFVADALSTVVPVPASEPETPPEPPDSAPTPEPTTQMRPHMIAGGAEQLGPTTTITVGRIRYTTRGTDIRVNHDKTSI